MTRIAGTQLEELKLGTRVRIRVPRQPIEIHRVVVPTIGSVESGRTKIWSDAERTEYLFGTVRDSYSLPEVVGYSLKPRPDGTDVKVPGGELDPELHYRVELDGGKCFVIVTPDMVRAAKTKRSRKAS